VRPLFRVAVLILGALVAVALLWVAVELHYLGCVSAAQSPAGWEPVDERQLSLPERPGQGCSRLPF
jgi:hypothetical protein